ncbi:DUF624 domain-containing protein [Antribacter gilvus]|uniref:DUF624 domain-containing protein n=1 Tax=Antribacter gilvus TaxID=2304675 RepID=UPI0013E01503|nr:DUF624 domain-containing protein [Antribacter gilvus]
MSAQSREFLDGPLGRVTSAVYWFLVVELLLVLAMLPGLVPLALLDRSVSNAPLVVLCLAPVGPALSAALFALRDRPRAESLSPGASFWKGYRLNVLDVLKLWVPALVVLGVIAVGLVSVGTPGVPVWYGGILIGIGGLVLMWTVNAVVVASFFGFRTRDVARLAGYYLFRLPLVALGVLSLLILATGIIVFTSDLLFVILMVFWAALVLRTVRPLLRDVEERFTE